MSDTDQNYEPVVGDLDESIRPETGTLLRLTIFTHRYVPKIEDLDRQIAQRFGLRSADWKILLTDSTQPADTAIRTRQVGEFGIQKMEKTEIRFAPELDNSGAETGFYRAYTPEGHIRSDLQGGFTYDGHFYPVLGWVGYAKENYKDDLMAGIRIYCRGKIASQTNIFNMKSGFTGEYDIRSYLVGELHADWLDEAEDLIQTDRRDILWSHELGEAFEQWGQGVVKKIGAATRDPMKKKTWDIFKETSDVEQKINRAFPSSEHRSIRERALKLAKFVGQGMRPEEALDPERTDAIVQLSLTFAPHYTLDEKLREAGDSVGSPLTVITDILKTARIAELASFGQIADDRIKVINRVETLKDDSDTLEAVFQKLIEAAPWLIDPQWSPISANQAFSTLKVEFEKYYKAKTGQDISLNQFADTTKRADFVLSTQDGVLQIIEIKRPSHRFEDEEMGRLNNYVMQMTNFLNEPNHSTFKELFPRFHVTLVCDGEKLTGLAKTAFDGLRNNGTLTYIDWTTFLLNTKRMHEAFLQEAERQKRDAAQT